MALYAYIAADGSRKVVDSVNLAFTGPWSGSTSYQAFDVADDGQSHKWVALIANTNTPLPTVFDTSVYSTWAHLVQLDASAGPYVPVAGEWLGDVWAGTNYAAGLFDQAYNLAVAGTDAAAAAQSTADSALALAIVGTNAADQAYSLAQQALDAAWAGTNQPAIEGVYTIAVTALNTSWTGTTAADQAYSLAQQALDAAWAGTNQPAIDGVYAIAVTALNTAWAGTTAAAAAQATADSALALAQPSSGTVPMSVAVNGTIAYNFAGNTYQFTTVDSNLFITGTNMQAVREIAVVLRSTGSSRSLAYDGNFQFFGATPPTSISNKDVVVSLTSTGNTLSSVIAAASAAV